MNPQDGMTLWVAEIWCVNPSRKRTIWPIAALSEDQAIILAEKRASELFGKKKEGWTSLEVHMPNMT